VVTNQFERTPWIRVAPARAPALPKPEPVQPSLFAGLQAR